MRTLPLLLLLSLFTLCVITKADWPPTIGCAVCTDFVKLLNGLVQKKVALEEIEDIVYEFCVLRKIELHDVCRGIVQEFGPEIVHIFAEMDQPTTTCDLLGLCPSSWWDTPWVKESEIKERLDKLKETIKPIRMKPLVASTPASQSLVFHISDMHVDPDYAEGSNENCDRPMCCRAEYGNGSAGYWGTLASCDLPVHSYHALLQGMQNINPNPEFIFFTGDSPPHDVWEQSIAEQMNASLRFYTTILEYFPNTTVFPVIGNHEFYPLNQNQPPPGNFSVPIMSQIAELWKKWLPEDAVETLLEGGYYTVSITPQHRMIVLNLEYCDTTNFWLLLNWSDPTYDPAGQLAWLNETLYNASLNNERVWLASHMPFGSSGCKDNYSSRLHAIFLQYPDLVTGSFAGHTHSDYFHLYYDADANPFMTTFIAPSVTTFSNRNPSFRYYLYDPETTLVSNYFQYYANITAANEAGPSVAPQWEIAYDAVSEWNVTVSDPNSWNELLQRLKADDELYTQFCYHYFSENFLYAGNNTCTDKKTKAGIFCEIASGSGDEYKACMLTKTSVSYVLEHTNIFSGEC